MEFMNVGGGELLIIILLALVLFSPEDILKLMRTIGGYARTARQMWSNVSKNLQEEYIPDEVKEIVKETTSTVKDAKSTLSGVRKNLSSMSAEVKEDIDQVSTLADKEVAEAVTTINPGKSGANATRNETSKHEHTASEAVETAEITDEIDVSDAPEMENGNSPGTDDVLDALFFDEKAQNIKDSDQSITITKAKPADPSYSNHDNGADSPHVKLAKTIDNTLKDDGHDI